MKKYLLLIAVCFLTICNHASAQTTPGPAQQKLLDSLCDGLTRIDLSKIKTKKAAYDAFMNCFAEHSDLLIEVAKEENVDFTDKPAMHELGIAVGKNLLVHKCPAFMKIAIKMAKDDEDAPVALSLSGTFKRIDSKDFNYIVIADKNGSEKSFLWLREFPGSDKFMEGAALKLAGKKLDINYQDIEVYLPKAKGYYKVKEITGIDIL
ncbi:hypothetical protein SAMN05216464_114113 [Mucilaginibacter pineti]|uniref:Uncharacterized protein n=1 Tax=Mucilaginibacter pineti TaxID=1391627 RepID=A0A1G7JA15_9SPHI|nr:hypothetical protein [Mucilaginibacter pineti]SDF21807.1 hypothetical protein SAMN05216464_114113 [Mucilaginibacter pineti]